MFDWLLLERYFRLNWETKSMRAFEWGKATGWLFAFWLAASASAAASRENTILAFLIFQLRAA